MRQRILFFIESMGCGGAERSLSNLLSQIDYDKYSVDLMLLHDSSNKNFEIPPQVNVFCMPRPGYIGRIWNGICHLYHSIHWRIAAKYGKRIHGAEMSWSCMSTAYPRLSKQYDVAIAYQQGLPTYYVATKVKARRKIAWINVNIVNAGYRREFNRPYYNRYDSIVTVSNDLNKIMSQSGYVPPEKLSVIYDIVDVSHIRQKAIEEDIPDVFGDMPLKITTVGRVATQKNYALAVRTAAELRARGAQFRWVFVGDGPEMGNIHALIHELELEDMVVSVGRQTNPYLYIKACDIYVQTSLFEGFGLTIAEAKALGKPIVSTDFDVVYDQIEDGVNGLISEMTPSSLADKILELHNNPHLAQKLSEAVLAEENRSKSETRQRFNELLS